MCVICQRTIAVFKGMALKGISKQNNDYLKFRKEVKQLKPRNLSYK